MQTQWNFAAGAGMVLGGVLASDNGIGRRFQPLRMMRGIRQAPLQALEFARGTLFARGYPAFGGCPWAATG